MGNYSQLKSAINAVITANGQNDITGTVLNNVLNTMVTSIGSGYLFKGVATPSTAPGTPDQNVFYVGGKGTYSNFGSTPVTIGAYEVGFFKYNGTWSNEKVTLTVDEQVTSLSDNLITSGAVAEAITNALNEGYLFKGVATPSMTPAERAHKIFYLAVEGGTYTNFQNYGTPITVQDGISIIFGDVTWIPQLLVGIDDNPTPASDNLVRSRGVASHIVYDISEANSGATFADLTAALNNGDNIPEGIRKGGMSIKYIQSSDNKYVQYRLMSNVWSVTPSNWQGVDDEPTAGSNNLVKSGSVYSISKSLGLNYVNLDLVTGFYGEDLTLYPNTNWKCCLINDISSYGGLLIYTSVRDAAYVSITDASDNILWQSNSINEVLFLDLTQLVGASKLYFCCETIRIRNPFVYGLNDSIFQKIQDIYEQIGGVELINGGLFDGGFYDSNLTFIPNENWQCGKYDISKYALLNVNAAVRSGAYVSLVDNLGNILWQTNSSATNSFVLDLSEYTNYKYLYYSNEKSVLASPSIKGTKKGVALEVEKLADDLFGKELIVTLDNGFYDSSLTFIANEPWRCCKIDISNYGILSITAAVRSGAYLSLTDSNENILWQTNNSNTTKFSLNLEEFTDAKYLYYSNEVAVVSVPSVLGFAKGLFPFIENSKDYIEVSSEQQLRYCINGGYKNIIIATNIELSDTITINYPVIVDGRGNALTFNQSVTGKTSVFTINSKNVKFKNLNVVGTQNLTYLIVINEGGKQLNAEDCTFSTSSDDVLFIGGECILTRCDVSHSYGNDGAGIVYSGKLYAYNSVFHDNFDEGASSHSSSYAEFYECEFYNNGYVVGTNTKGAPSSYGGCHLGGGLMGKVIGCYSHDNCTFGIGLINFHNLTLTDKEVCYNNVVENNGEAGIFCMNCRDITLVNNSVINNSGNAIVFGEPDPAPGTELVASAGYVAGNIMFENTTNSVVVEGISMPDLHIQS